MKSRPKVGAVIVAAGESQRMGGIDKVFAQISGETVLARVIDTFQKCMMVSHMVIVLSKANLKRGQQMAAEQGWTKVRGVFVGGKRRQDSVVAGLRQLDKCDWVVIQDGARPLTTIDLIHKGLEVARETGAAVAAVPVTDTIKMAGDDSIILETPPRHNLWAVQTPQVFRSDIIADAYHKAKGDVTDDASLVETLGYKVKVYMGSYDNIKITTPADLTLAEILAQKHE